jgi:hypothetical protein
MWASRSLFKAMRMSKPRFFSWDAKQLRKSTVYSANIASYKGEHLDSRFIDTKYVLYAKCQDPLSFFDDLIVARHRNAQKKGGDKDIISFLVSARTLVGKRFWMPYGIQLSNQS